MYLLSIQLPTKASFALGLPICEAHLVFCLLALFFTGTLTTLPQASKAWQGGRDAGASQTSRAFHPV